MGDLNFNFIRNKFEILEKVIKRNLSIIFLSEIKLHDSFPSAQFILKGYCISYRFDSNLKGGKLFLCIREYIHPKFLKSKG